ncbi:hypothetical protein RN001_011674 [Aquatica leii]|uniref:Nuclear cap-binding protein subunit 3 n=1 Tax=Aquatica leii TaxID=1421715 RepID=A0AAN7SCY1_9COLE|nr:hypothetical protein RN001_011674 [Aquatica leii]
MATVTTRPNIRIEIQNNLVEPMDVDEDEKQADSDIEDGEINDEPVNENKLPTQSGNARIWNNKDEGFATGIDIFNEKDHEKLQERANRFGLNPNEIANFTNEDLLKLHTSLGITSNNEKDIRFEAIHLRGTEEMSTEDVFEYFGKYVPNCLEWIDDESCNVVWQDKLSAARALHFISKAVKGMPVEGSCDPFVKDLTETPKEEQCRSILLSNNNREVEIAKEDVDDNENIKDEETVNLSDISVPIPPGYWRLGVSHPKAKFLMLRFAFKSDKKPLKAERFSEYYKKYGNPNFGGLKGIISGSCRNKFKGIFERNKDIVKASVDTKNPWGDLAENWNEDERYSEQLYIAKAPKVVEDVTVKPVVVSGKSEVLKRLGVKRNHESNQDSSEDQTVKKVTKMPRMRMYADEEEVKIKRKKQLLEIKQKTQQEVPQTSDLRNMIGLKKERDLGVKLKNRHRREENKTEASVVVSKPSEPSTKYTSREKSTRHSPSAEHHSRHESAVHRRSSRHTHGKSYRNKLHSDKYEQEHHSQYNSHKPRSKVAVVIKTQKRPTVASTIWSRITPKKERLKTASERLQSRRDSSSSSESSTTGSSSSSSSESQSSDSSSESEDESNDEEQTEQRTVPLQRPGFSNASAAADRKSPLRIEINNDHFKEE